jgi:hypothetical protein
MTTVLGIAVLLTPVAVVLGLLQVTNHLARRREMEGAQQVMLTDAIHRELGAVAAPVVTRRLGGGWVVAMRVPLDRPGTVAGLLRITHAQFGEGGARPVRIVLTPQTPSPALTVELSRAAGRRRAESLAPALR